jgi:hypothetical protein
MSRFSPHQYPNVRDTAREQERFSNQVRSQRHSVTLTPSQVSGQSSNEETVTVTCSSGDDVIVNGPSQPSGVVLGQAYVSARNTVKVPFINVTGGNLTPTSGTYKIRVMR